jgi:hypothetical protein
MRKYYHNYTHAEIDASCQRAADLTSNPKQTWQEWVRGRIVFSYKDLQFKNIAPINISVRLSRDAMGCLYPDKVESMFRHEFKRLSFIYIPDRGFGTMTFTPSYPFPKTVTFFLDRNMKGNQIIIENSKAKHTINILE